jgi:5-methylcytosine-specific restriction protein A
MSTNKRIRGRKLQEIRQAHFRMQPLCVQCLKLGRTSVATQLDHIVALVNGGQDVADNRQGLCDACHDLKTAQDLARIAPRRIGLDGFPVSEDSHTRPKGHGG